MKGYTTFKYNTEGANTFAHDELDFKFDLLKALPKDLQNSPLVFEVPAGTVMELRNVKIRSVVKKKD